MLGCGGGRRGDDGSVYCSKSDLFREHVAREGLQFANGLVKGIG